MQPARLCDLLKFLLLKCSREGDILSIIEIKLSVVIPAKAGIQIFFLTPEEGSGFLLSQE